MNKPILYIIAGCNGAGKTTASYTVLPEILDCKEFVNADEIAKGLSPFNPEEVAIQAGKLMLQRIEFLLNANVSFAIETTLASRSYQNLVRRAQGRGYIVILLFFWLPTVNLAKLRVQQRVKSGGHNIPNDVIERRYELGIRNLFKVYMPIVDEWAIYLNELSPLLIATNKKITHEQSFIKLKNYVGD